MNTGLPSNASEQSKKLFGLVVSKKSEIVELLGRYDAKNLRIFGSVASGEATENSDIDMIYSSDSVDDLLVIMQVARQLSDILGVKVEAFPEEFIEPSTLDEIKKMWVLVV
jgi:predicted nucleotidyltransferase